ncbi:MAG: hypothetical protein QOF48_1804, partial [Verrucomicrobiota bacterium]
MTSASQPRITQRSIIAGAAVLVLAVAGFLFWVIDGNSPGLLKAVFVRFENSSDGTNNLAVLFLTNSSNKTFTLFKDGNSDRIFSMCIPTGTMEETVAMGGNAVHFSLGPGSNATFRVQLPQTGKVVHLAVLYILPARKVPRVLVPMQLFCWRVFRPKFVQWAVCDQDIQCP